LRPIRHFFPSHLRLLISIFACLIIFFTFLRLILLVIHMNELVNVPLLIILEALFIGIRFDATVSGYILLIPFIVLSMVYFLPWKKKWIAHGCIVYIIVLSEIALLITVVNISFFNHYHFPITLSIFDWSDQPFFVSRMLFYSWSYYPFLFLFCIVGVSFILLVIGLIKKINISKEIDFLRSFRLIVRTIIISICAFVLLLLAIRGRIAEKSPIRWGTAYFCQYPFPNQLALNPVFTFIQSWIERNETANQEITFLEDHQAIKNVRQYFHLSDTQSFDSPIARRIASIDSPTKQNVILVLMENMAAWKMHRYGNPDNLTPFLDSLAEQSIVFDQFYSSGIHTFNGIYSSLFGLPALLHRHPMKPTESIQSYTGIAHTLGKHGYQTAYFCTHDAEFDNMAGFLSNNGFQQIISEKDYPQNEIKSTLGVPDHILFDEALPRLHKLSANTRPFFAAFLTASDHIPHVIPEGIEFHPHATGMDKNIVEYADWSIGHFLKLAESEPWYENTIFIFIADHGSARDSQYGLTLSAHHSPCLIFFPRLNHRGKVYSILGTQLDIYPTIMGLLNISYINNTFGIDLLRETRPYVFFNSDETSGCLDETHLLVLNQDGQKSLFDYKHVDNIDQCSTQPILADSMSMYVRSMYQTAQWMIKHRKVGEPQEITSK
jgi:phosphoglycerol transferase MdoB-like AlkP superfamily enzyme